MTNNVEQEVIDILAKEIQQEIDFEVMSSILLKDGWSKVVLKPMVQETSSAIDQWLSTHCPKDCMHMGLVFLFKEQKVANWFALTWL